MSGLRLLDIFLIFMQTRFKKKFNKPKQHSELGMKHNRILQRDYAISFSPMCPCLPDYYTTALGPALIVVVGGALQVLRTQWLQMELQFLCGTALNIGPR